MTYKSRQTGFLQSPLDVELVTPLESPFLWVRILRSQNPGAFHQVHPLERCAMAIGAATVEGEQMRMHFKIKPRKKVVPIVGLTEGIW